MNLTTLCFGRVAAGLMLAAVPAGSYSAEWKPADAPIMTRWAKDVTPDNAWQEYPRPRMVRDGWTNLNGLWDYAVTAKDALRPSLFDGEILVPFPIEAPLSGVGREMKVDEAIWYSRSFAADSLTNGDRLLLHFEASDWETTAWVNGTRVGLNRGGYDPFTFDITDALIEGDQELVVRVWDPQTSIFKSTGKQGNRSSQYERCSGLWQTVWLERVPEVSINTLSIDASAKSERAVVSVEMRGDGNGLTIELEAIADGESVIRTSGVANESLALDIPNARAWSVDEPFLYDLKVSLLRDGKVIDAVDSYFGLRDISLGDSDHGRQMLLNGEEIFQMGPLDQNYWPGGGLTPPSDAAMVWEVDYLKRIGCNMVRLHIKQNPRRWYAHCDRAGLLVWQDFIAAKGSQQPSPEESEQWLLEQRRMMDTLQGHPSLVMWIVFNESWGQHDTERITNWTQGYDPTRLTSVASGWTDFDDLGHIRDIHDYTFCPAVIAPGIETKRAVILGECGGFAGAVPPHNWTGRSNETGDPKNLMFGGFDPSVPRDDNRTRDIFRPTFTHGEPFEKQYARFVDNLVLMKNSGLTAAVYTQMSDMKLEENGWLTFDREVSKIDVDALRAIHERLYEAAPVQRPLLSASLDEPQSWRYSASKQTGDDWTRQDFDDAAWSTGKGPIGNSELHPGSVVWNGGKLYLRTTVDLDETPKAASLRVYSYFTKKQGRNAWNYARVSINGQFIHDDATRQFKPELRVADIRLDDKALGALRKGVNTIAIELEPGYDPKRNKTLDTIARLVFDFALMEVVE